MNTPDLNLARHHAQHGDSETLRTMASELLKAHADTQRYPGDPGIRMMYRCAIANYTDALLIDAVTPVEG